MRFGPRAEIVGGSEASPPSFRNETKGGARRRHAPRRACEEIVRAGLGEGERRSAAHGDAEHRPSGPGTARPTPDDRRRNWSAQLQLRMAMRSIAEVGSLTVTRR